MKRTDLLSTALDALLACLMAIAGAGCLATAFRMDVDMEMVAMTAAVFSLLSALCTRLRRGWLLLVLTALGCLWLLYEQDFYSNFCSTLNKMLSLYDLAYGWGVPEAIAEYDEWDLTLTVQTVTACCAVLAGVCLAKCQHPLAALAVLLPVLPCLVITDTVPAEHWLLLAILVLALLAMTNHSRRTDTRQANRLTILLLIPLLLAGILLFAHTPRSEYRPPDGSKGIFSLVESLAEYFPFLNQNSGDAGDRYPAASDTVNLNTLGPRPNSYSKVLEVVASQTGGLYLRGHSYMGYTGLSWAAWPETETMEPPGQAYLEEKNQTIQIKVPAMQTGQNHVQRFFPYYPSQSLTLVDGALIQDVRDDYLFRFKPLRQDWQTLWQSTYATLTVDNSDYAALRQYLQLPEGTAYRASAHLQKAGVKPGANILQIAHRIGTYVQSSAAYDLDTPSMPAYETDFALWFLEESYTGYCVHFASAATVLLRAAGIPARYVEGYLVDARAGQTTTVRAQNAHAWVEYYVPNLGWVILEATPSEGLPIQPPTEPTEPTQPTEPPQTTRPTFPTEPTEPTEPTQPTQPTGPTEPSQPTEPTDPAEPTQPTDPPQTTAPTQPTQPAPAPTPPRDYTWLKQLLGWMGMALAILAVLIGQWRLRLKLRRKAIEGSDWRPVYRRWRYACLLARLCRHRPPKPLLELVKKAKFSRDGLNGRELRQFDRYYTACIRGLKRHPMPMRMLYRLILAAW